MNLARRYFVLDFEGPSLRKRMAQRVRVLAEGIITQYRSRTSAM